MVMLGFIGCGNMAQAMLKGILIRKNLKYWKVFWLQNLV